SFFCCPPCRVRDLLSFPTRRSSDLFQRPSRSTSRVTSAVTLGLPSRSPPIQERKRKGWHSSGRGAPSRSRQSRSRWRGRSAAHRSEEHTSELQSRENLVCRLLLEKK